MIEDKATDDSRLRLRERRQMRGVKKLHQFDRGDGYRTKDGGETIKGIIKVIKYHRK